MKKIVRNGIPLIRRFATASPEMPPCDFVPDKYEGKPYTQIREIRAKHLAPCLKTLYQQPLLVHQGYMQWLFDHTGRRYLDMFGGIVTVSVGHCHPKVVEATTKQMKRLWHTTNIYLYPGIHEYAEKLTSKLPGDLQVVYFVNSGSEANDLAMMIARAHTGYHDLISLRNSYHGMSSHTMGLTAHSTWKYNVVGSSGIHHAMNPDPFKGPWGGRACRDSPVQTNRQCDCENNQCKASDLYYDQLEEIFKYSLPGGKVAGIFAESIQGVGGTVQFPHKYLQRAQHLVQSKGGLYIADEVQTGFGRTGDHFWGFEAHGVTPDIVTMAKGMGNGFPMAAVVTTPRIAQCLTGALHFNTFGGNPLACTVGKTVLEIMEEEKTQARCKEVGSYLLRGLGALRERYGGAVRDVRGKGLMIGVELRGPRLTLAIMEHCRTLGVLLGKGGLEGNVLRIKPPMCITREDADFTLQVLQDALEREGEEAGQKGVRASSKEYVFLSGV